MFLIVAAVAEGVIYVVSGKLKRAEHRLISHPPIAALKIVVVAAVLEKNAKWLVFDFSNEGRV